MRSTAAKFPDYFAVRLAAGDRWVIEVPDDAAVALAHYCCVVGPTVPYNVRKLPLPRRLLREAVALDRVADKRAHNRER